MNQESFSGDHLIGRNIRHRRWQRGETQLELAEKLGISLREVKLYETGVRSVPVLLLKRIATAQETSIEYYRDELGPFAVASTSNQFQIR